MSNNPNSGANESKRNVEGSEQDQEYSLAIVLHLPLASIPIPE